MSQVDVEAIKASVDLVEFASRYTHLDRVSSSNRGEYAGPCPRCGGEDRFHVQGRGLWMCRRCHPQWGDVIEFVCWLDQVPFAEACTKLSARHMSASLPRPSMPVCADAGMSTNVPPGEKWQEMARTVVELAERRLLEHPEALAYLQGRGLTENTIRRGRLGYIPHDAFDDDVARWGLSKEEAKAVWLPRGWTIPWMVGDLIWSVKIRRPNEDTEQAKSWNQNHSGGERKIDAKYLSIRRDGQAEGLSLYNADALSGHADVILVEGEFDALLLDQELGGVVPAATLASASRGIDSAALLHLIQMRRIWTSYDSDAAGDEGAKRLNAKSLRIRRLKWPDNGIKDVTDLWKAGYDLVTWALSQVGPIWTPERVKWCEWWLERLKDDPQPQRQRIVAFLRREAAQLGVEHEPVADSPVPAMRMVSPVAIAAASKRSGVLPREDIVPDAETPCPPAKCWACGKERFWLRPSPSGADWLCCACQPSPTGQPRLLSIRGVIQPEQPGMV